MTITRDQLGVWQAHPRVDMRGFAVLSYLNRVQGDASYLPISQPIVAKAIKTSLRSLNRTLGVLKAIHAVEVIRWPDGSFGYAVLPPKGITPEPTEVTPNPASLTPPVASLYVDFLLDSPDSQESPPPPRTREAEPTAVVSGQVSREYVPPSALVRRFLAEQPDMADAIPAINQKFNDQLRRRSVPCEDVENYWLNFAKLEKRYGSGNHTAPASVRPSSIDERRRFNADGRASDRREWLARKSGSGFPADCTMAG